MQTYNIQNIYNKRKKNANNEHFSNIGEFENCGNKE